MPERPDRFTLLTAARLLDGTGAPPIEGAALLIEDGRVARIGPRGEIHAPDGARVRALDYGEATILPGLVNAHTHLVAPGDGTPGDDVAKEDDDILLLQAAKNAQIIGINRIPYLLTNKVDIVISVMGATPQRAQQVAFTSPYAGLFLGVYGPKGVAVKSPADLGTRKVGLPRGTTQDISLTEMAPRASIVRFEDEPDLLRWLDTFIFFHKLNGDIGKLHEKWFNEKMQELPTF